MISKCASRDLRPSSSDEGRACKCSRLLLCHSLPQFGKKWWEIKRCRGISPMKFGLHYQLPCSPSQSPVQRYRDTIAQAVYAETLGFESVWPVEQHFDAGFSILPSPLLLL